MKPKDKQSTTGPPHTPQPVGKSRQSGGGKLSSSQSFTTPATTLKDTSSLSGGPSVDAFIGKLSKVQLRVLQDAMYNAAENGFLDTISEFRIAGKKLNNMSPKENFYQESLKDLINTTQQN